MSALTAPVPQPIAKSAVAIRTALPESTRVEFDQQWRAPLAAAAADFDLGGVFAVIEEF